MDRIILRVSGSDTDKARQTSRHTDLHIAGQKDALIGTDSEGEKKSHKIAHKILGNWFPAAGIIFPFIKKTVRINFIKNYVEERRKKKRE